MDSVNCPRTAEDIMGEYYPIDYTQENRTDDSKKILRTTVKQQIEIPYIVREVSCLRHFHFEKSECLESNEEAASVIFL